MKIKYEYDVVIGIDIGLSGGISFFDTVSDEILSISEMPNKKFTNKSGKEKKVIDLDKLFFLLEIPSVHKETAIVVFEDVHSFGNLGFGVGTLMEEKGIIRGMAKALGYGELAVSPKEWQKHFGIVCPKDVKSTTAPKTRAMRKKWLKSKSMETAKNLFESWDARIKHDGISDSLLIARWYLDK